MRIERLDLLRYGHFTDRSINLPAGAPDLHVIFGPNEAGKSTALAAIEEFLFGMHGQTPYGFLHGYKDMRIGAVLEHAGKRVELQRRKGNRDTLLDADGLPVAGGEAALGPFLSGADRAFFERMFSLDHQRLEAGGQDILEARDDIGQMLFAAGAGIGGLRERLNHLLEEGDSLWSPGRKSQKRRYSAAEDAMKAARDELRAHAVSAGDWQKLRDAYQEAKAAHYAINADVQKATREENRLNRIRRVYRDVRRKQELDGLLHDLGEVIPLPADAGDQVATAEAEDTKATTRISTLKAQLERAEATRDTLIFDEALIHRAADIREFGERRIEIRAGRADLPKRRAELELAEGNLTAAAAELGWRGETPAQLAARIPPRPDVAVVRALLGSRGALVAEGAAAARLLAEARQAQDDTATALAGSGETRDTSGLARALKSVRGQGDITGRLRSASESVTTADARVTRRLNALVPAIANEAQLLATVAPPRALVEAERDLRADWQQRLTALQQEAISLRRERDGAQAALERALREEQVVSAEDLHEARASRDELWQLLKLRHVDGAPLPPDLAARHEDILDDLAGAFPPAVAKADRLADRRFDHAEGAARIAEITRTLDEHDTRLAILGKDEHRLAAEGRDWHEEWDAIWSDAPFAPGEPAVMLEWLDARELVLEAIEARDEARSALRLARDTEAAARAQLMGELVALGGDADVIGTPALDILVEQAAEALHQHQAIAEYRARLEDEVAQTARQVRQREQDETRAKDVLTDWQGRWNAALASLGLAADTPPEAVEAQVAIIDQIREIAAEIATLKEDRIDKIERDITAFEAAATQLMQSLAPDLGAKPADDAVTLLVARLGDAEQARSLHKKQLAEITELTRQIAEDEGQRAEWAASLSHLKQAAGAADLAALKLTIERSDRQRDLMSEREEILDTLDQEGDGFGIDALEAECEGMTPDDVAAGLGAVKSRLADLRIELEAAAETRFEARQSFDAIDGDDAAAQAAASMREAQAEMGEAAARYARVKTAALLLQWAIDRYRRDRQAPLLRRAGELFATLTGGSFAGLRVDFDEKDNAQLAGVRPDDSAVPVQGMSTGTADQLYLALRVGAMEDYLDRAAPLPFIADDLFINFDNTRAAAGLQILARLAEKTQVLFFTHHRHLVDLAEVTLGSGLHCVSLGEQAGVDA